MGKIAFMTQPKTELYHGNNLHLMSSWKDNKFDAIITDPPYASGGLTTTSRSQAPEKKYQNSGAKKKYPTFANDDRDERSHYLWSVRWMEEALRLTKPGGWLMTFTDWRLIRSVADAVCVAGWTWRGIVVWDKTEACRPQPGRHRNQCEYVITATKGPVAKWTTVCPAGCFREYLRPGDKHHLTAKPVALMEHLLSIMPEGAHVLDPFAGSGSTLVAAKERGIHSTGIELTEEYYKIAYNRIHLE